MEERSICDIEIEKKLKTFVVHNPVSGLSQAEVVREKISQAMEEHHIPIEIYETTGKEDIHDLVKTAIKNAFERFVAAVGMGLSQVCRAARCGLKSLWPLSRPGLSTRWRVSCRSPWHWITESAVAFRLSKKVIDVIDVGGRYYLLNVSVGTSAKIMKEVRREDIIVLE